MASTHQHHLEFLHKSLNQEDFDVACSIVQLSNTTFQENDPYIVFSPATISDFDGNSTTIQNHPEPPLNNDYNKSDIFNYAFLNPSCYIAKNLNPISTSAEIFALPKDYEHLCKEAIHCIQESRHMKGDDHDILYLSTPFSSSLYIQDNDESINEVLRFLKIFGFIEAINLDEKSANINPLYGTLKNLELTLRYMFSFEPLKIYLSLLQDKSKNADIVVLDSSANTTPHNECSFSNLNLLPHNASNSSDSTFCSNASSASLPSNYGECLSNSNGSNSSAIGSNSFDNSTKSNQPCHFDAESLSLISSNQKKCGNFKSLDASLVPSASVAGAREKYGNPHFDIAHINTINNTHHLDDEHSTNNTLSVKGNPIFLAKPSFPQHICPPDLSTSSTYPNPLDNYLNQLTIPLPFLNHFYLIPAFINVNLDSTILVNSGQALSTQPLSSISSNIVISALNNSTPSNTSNLSNMININNGNLQSAFRFPVSFSFPLSQNNAKIGPKPSLESQGSLHDVGNLSNSLPFLTNFDTVSNNTFNNFDNIASAQSNNFQSSNLDSNLINELKRCRDNINSKYPFVKTEATLPLPYGDPLPSSVTYNSRSLDLANSITDKDLSIRLNCVSKSRTSPVFTQETINQPLHDEAITNTLSQYDIETKNEDSSTVEEEDESYVIKSNCGSLRCDSRRTANQSEESNDCIYSETTYTGHKNVYHIKIDGYKMSYSKKTRLTVSLEERDKLEKFYNENQYPSRVRYDEIRRILGWTSSRRVTKWFNNRRYNIKQQRYNE